jgi:hypothetical protein
MQIITDFLVYVTDMLMWIAIPFLLICLVVFLNGSPRFDRNNLDLIVEDSDARSTDPIE